MVVEFDGESCRIERVFKSLQIPKKDFFIACKINIGQRHQQFKHISFENQLSKLKMLLKEIVYLNLYSDFKKSLLERFCIIVALKTKNEKSDLVDRLTR